MSNTELRLWQKIFLVLITLSLLFTIGPIILTVVGFTLPPLLGCSFAGGISVQCPENELLSSIFEWMIVSHWFTLITVQIGTIPTLGLIVSYILIARSTKTNIIPANSFLKKTFILFLISVGFTIAPALLYIFKSLIGLETFDIPSIIYSVIAVPLGALFTIILLIILIFKK